MTWLGTLPENSCLPSLLMEKVLARLWNSLYWHDVLAVTGSLISALPSRILGDTQVFFDAASHR